MRQASLAEQIRTAIRQSGHSVNALSKHAKVDRAIIGRFLRDQRTVTLDTAELILAALGCSVVVQPPAQPELAEVKLPAPRVRARRRTARRLEKGGRGNG